MFDTERTLYRSTLFFIILGPLALYYTTGFILGGGTAIDIGNAALLSLAGGVTCAYSPIAFEAVKKPIVPRETVLGTGIFLSFFAITLARIGSIMWRASGQDPGWLDSIAWGMHIGISTGAALCHLIAPKAIRGAVPTVQWIKLGFLMAAGLAVFSVIVWIF